MKLTKRSEGEETPLPEEKPSGKKPVIVYILILFIAAFLLMTLSFVMHQRSNSQVMGELQHSVSAMQEVQAAQDRIIQLQEELDQAQKAVSDLENQATAAAAETQALREEIADLTLQSDALEALYALQQAYSARDFEVCREIIATMEAQDYPAALPWEVSVGTVIPPSQRYLQLKEAVEGR